MDQGLAINEVDTLELCQRAMPDKADTTGTNNTVSNNMLSVQPEQVFGTEEGVEQGLATDKVGTQESNPEVLPEISDTTTIERGVATSVMKLHQEHGVGTGNRVGNVLAKSAMSQGMRREGDKGASMSNELDVVGGNEGFQAKAEQPQEHGLGTKVWQQLEGAYQNHT